MDKIKASFNFDVIPKFIVKLYRVVDDDKYRGICWTPDGLKIHIFDRDVFIKETLPLISKTREFGTFIRMLNSYGFVKSKDIEEEDIYYNSNFRKGREDLLGLDESLRLIRRKKANEMKASVGSASMKEVVEYLYSQSQELYAELSACKEKIERQERMMNGLMEVLSRVFRTSIDDLGGGRQKSGVLGFGDEMDAFLGKELARLKRSGDQALQPLNQSPMVQKLSLETVDDIQRELDDRESDYDAFF
ncbi:heat shock transcription factor [Ordospora pajunii]|uniref:heat shock transcription factor n=1 Tax=Ordospora pajunii TaxID=3039483 RepID=UPI0029527B48|nr:heat shock transcription factor [Ordospora pajunii]KAH9411657.1 heat shock transcription factor [Ordospora pajunii]